MQNIFDTLIDNYIHTKVGIAENFLNKSLAANLAKNLNSLYTEKQLNAAGTGNDTLVEHNKLFRSDMIYWLDRQHNNPHENDFFDLIDKFVSHLNATCYTSITGYEFHYAYYEKGSFYKKHIDQFRNNSSRQYSLIFYLNEDWLATDGGELCIYHANTVQKISPENGKSVFFRSSDLEHEVLPATKARLSVTGWLKTG